VWDFCHTLLNLEIYTQKAKRKFYGNQITLTTISKINQIQNVIQISIQLQHIQEAE
jgi:hypothetical protein